MSKRVNRLNVKEFICIMAILMSITALSIDSILPALGQLAIDLNVADANDTQFIISSLFFGMGFGVMLYGPMSDSFGRKNTIYFGLVTFLIGTLVSIYATDLNTMIIGRMIQGFGGASCRVVSIAIIRDKYEGREMAKIMSLIMMVFIMVPALAPLLGQGILFIASWKMIFWFIFVFATIGMVWMHFRQRETLLPENRRQFSFSVIFSGAAETAKNPITLSFTFASGIMFGAFVSYLSTAQQIMQVQYELGDLFALYFGLLAIAYGASSYLNSKLLSKYTMQQVCFFFLVLQTLISFAFYLLSIAFDGNLPFNIFYTYMLANFFCIGALFGNFSSLALQPFGHMAGIATSVISSIQTIVAVIIGVTIGQFYNGTVQPLIVSFLLCGLVTLMIFLNIRNRSIAASDQ